LKEGRSHPPEPLHHRGSMRTLQICHPLLLSHCWCRHGILHLSLESCLGLGLELKSLHQPWKSLKETSELWWWWKISLLPSRRNMLMSSPALSQWVPECRRLGNIHLTSRTTSSTPLSHSNSLPKTKPSQNT